MKIRDIENAREYDIDTKSSPTSIFFSGPGGLCVEFDRMAAVAAIASEFDLIPAGLATIHEPA